MKFADMKIYKKIEPVRFRAKISLDKKRQQRSHAIYADILAANTSSPAVIRAAKDKIAAIEAEITSLKSLIFAINDEIDGLDLAY